MRKILYLALGSKVKGPLPKIDPIMVEQFRKNGFQVIRKDWGRHSDQESILQKIIGRLIDLLVNLKELYQSKPEIVYTSTTLDEMALLRDVPLLLLAKFSPAKFVLMMHGSKTSKLIGPGHFFYKISMRLVIRRAAAIFLLSNDEMDEWKRFEPTGKYFKVDNPFIPSTQVPSIHNDKYSSSPKLLFAGRLIKEKGAYDLIAAMPRILASVDCHLNIVGVGPELDGLQDLVNQLGLKNQVSFLGYQDSKNLSDLYQASSMLILPTYFGEGFPTVIAEAMSFGLPIITTCLRGAKDHLVEGENVLYVRPKNVDDIANAVSHLLENPSICNRMGLANLEKVKIFLPENTILAYLDAFQKIGVSN
jgi:glycosyltransferase involved in cell wall biosynthesis